MFPKVNIPEYWKQESERLYYRRLVDADQALWEEFFVDNPNLVFFGFDLSLSKAQLAANWFAMQMERYEKQGTGMLAVRRKEDGKLIGMTGLLSREIEGENEFEIGYSLIPAYWRKGYATEMAQTMKAFGRKHQMTDRFVSMIHVDNIGSIKVAKNNGMKPLFHTTYRELPIIVYGEERP